MEFITFWWECIKGAFEIGSGWLGLSEVFAAVILFLVSRQKPSHTESVDRTITKCSRWVLIGFLVLGFCFVAPYQQYSKMNEQKRVIEGQLKACEGKPELQSLRATLLGTAESIEHMLKATGEPTALYNQFSSGLDGLIPKLQTAGMWDGECFQLFSNDNQFNNNLNSWTNLVRLLRKKANQ